MMYRWHPKVGLLFARLCVVGIVMSTVASPLLATAQETSDARVEARAQQLFIRGLTMLQIDEPDAAIASFAEAIKLAPGQAALLSALAEAHEAQGDLETAQFYALQARDMTPANPAYHRQVAALYRQLRQPQQALAAYERLLAQTPDDTAALRDIAALHTALGSYHEALEAYERLNAVQGPQAGVLYQMVQLHQELGQRRPLMERLETLTQLEPEDPEPRRLLAQYRLEAGQTQQAIALLEEVRALNPSDADVVLTLSELYAAEGDMEESEAVLASLHDIPENASVEMLADRAATLLSSTQQAEETDTIEALLSTILSREPTHYRALVMRGQLRFERGAYAEAARLLSRALDENPREVEVWFQAALAHLEAGTPEEAAATAEEGLVLFPGAFILHRLAGYSHLEAGQTHRALDHLTDALDRGDRTGALSGRERSALLATIGGLEAQQGDTTAAEAAYAEALDADPSNATALNNYAYSLAEREARLDEALAMAEQAVEIAPRQAAFLDTLGWVHYKLGNLYDARTWIERAVATGEASAAVHEHLGDVLQALDLPEQARTHWQQALEQDPDRESARERLRSSE